MMDPTAQIIVAIGTLITAITAAAISLNNAFRLTRVAANVEKIEIATNSMKDQLVVATAKASHAVGTAEGLAAGRLEGHIDDPLKVEIVKVPPLEP